MSASMAYDAGHCSLVASVHEKGGRTSNSRHCVYQIVAVGTSDEPWIYSIFAQRKYHISYLQEGVITKEYLSKNSYSYYAFALPDYESIEAVTFFSTTLSGQSVLLVSNSEQFPTI